MSQISQENTCARDSFFNKVDSGTGVFLRNIRNFEEHLFHRTPPVAASGWGFLRCQREFNCLRYELERMNV